MDKNSEILSFREETTEFEFIDLDGIPFNNIGDGETFKSDLYAPGTNIFDDIKDPILGSNEGTINIIAQLGNGDLISEITETFELPLGKIFTNGFYNDTEYASGGTAVVRITGGTGNYQDISGVEKFTLPDTSNFNVADVSFQALKEINGTRGDDNIVGKKHSELIAGNNGNDTIKGGQGNDIISGGRGGDIIRGGAGDDTLAADRVDRFEDFDGSTSELKGDNGNDIIYGGSKDDIIGGGNDNDLLFGQDGDDLIRGGKGFDLLSGGVGNDTIRGQDGIDVADYSDLTFNGVFGDVAGLDVNLNKNEAKHSSNNNALSWIDTLTTVENVQGTSRNDRFIGDENNNIFYGLEEVGRDDRQTEFISLNGESYKVTGDVVEYSGNKSDFTFGVSQPPFLSGLTVTSLAGGTDTLIDIEFLKFDDGVVAISDVVKLS